VHVVLSLVPAHWGLIPQFTLALMKFLQCDHEEVSVWLTKEATDSSSVLKRAVAVWLTP
jgi:hypothetical protein